MTQQALVLGLLYNAQATLAANRIQNLPPRTSWNAQEWDLR